MEPKLVNERIAENCLIDPKTIVIDLHRSQGSYLVDIATGRSYLDCFSQFASQPLGWNHPKMIGNRNRLADVALHKVANSDMNTVEYCEFVEEFRQFVPKHPHLFFIDGGALAVENALKVAFDWKMRKLGWKNDHMANMMSVVYLREAFHGRTGYTMSMTNSGDQSNPKTWGFPKFANWSRVTNPKCLFKTDGTPDENKAAALEKLSLSELKEALNHPMIQIAALVIEPIQGEGGDNHFRKEYFKELRKLADKHEFLLIFDEVQTGVGLTGKFWAYEHFGVEPDIICFGKKTQVCGIAANNRIDDVDNCFKVFSRINSTWGGNLIDMVRSTMQLKIIRDDGLVDNAEEIGEYFLGQLRGLYTLGKKKVSNVRGRGLMIAFDLDSTETRDEVLEKLGRNVLALPCGKKSIRFRPHLTFSRSDVDKAMDYIKRSL